MLCSRKSLIYFFMESQGSFSKPAVLKTTLSMDDQTQAEQASKQAASRQWCASVQSYDVHAVLFLVLWIFALSANHPFYSLEWKTLSTRYVQYKVPVHRHRDPLRMIVNSAHLPSKFKIAVSTDLTEDFKSKKQVREYIEDHVLSHSAVGDKDAQQHYGSLAIQEFSPLQVTMFLMGCYGYAYNDKHTKNITQMLELPIWSNWSTPFLLQALETKHKSSHSPASVRDHSACTCMKDFSSPTLLNLKDNVHVLESTPKAGIVDACTVQRTIDYALDGASANVVSAGTGLAKSVMLYKPDDAAANPRLRQQQDPFYAMIEAVQVEVAAMNNVDKTSFTARKTAFVAQYCIIVTDCASLTSAAGDSTHAAFFTWLKDNVDNVQSHNKLRPPKLCGGDNAQVPCPTNANQKHTPYLSKAGYAAYIEKYLEAFKMCSREGTPRYSTMRLGYLEPHKIYNVGQSFLLLAAIFAFMWSNVIGYYVEYHKKVQFEKVDKDERYDTKALNVIKHVANVESDLKSLTRWSTWTGMCVYLAVFFVLFALGRCARLWGKSPFVLDTDDKGQIEVANDQASNFFMVFFWFISIAFIFLFSFVYCGVMLNSNPNWKKRFDEEKEKLQAKAAQPVVSATIGYPEPPSFSSGSEMLGTTTPGRMVDKEYLREYNDQLVTHLQTMQRFAHVALDLTLIAGLTIIAVAIVVMQGVMDINVLSAISVMFLLVGTISHLSHMMRLVHVYLQYDPRFVQNKIMYFVAPKRIALILVTVVLLAMYWGLAGIEETVVESHLLALKYVFTFSAFFIWYLADIVFEFPCWNWNQEVTKQGYDAINRVERFWTHLRYKHLITSYTIVLAVLLMSLLRASVVFAAAKDRTLLVKTAATAFEKEILYKELSMFDCWLNREP